MPIASLVEQHKLEPDATPILTAAFDQVWAKIKASGKPIANETATRTILAKRIIERAKEGERDVARLVEDALAHFAVSR